MNLSKYFLFVLTSILFCSCKSVENGPTSIKKKLQNNYLTGSSISLEDVKDTTFVNLKSVSNSFTFDMKYATADNFLKQPVYDCADCYLRIKTIKPLIEANNEFLTKGYHIKLFDCYRPLSIQKKMWKIYPNADYVADPQKGSVHNRGCAVDITLVDVNGKELDMGTPFDFFGEASSHNYQNLSEEVKKNRDLLKEVMLKHNFISFDSEWWHYNLKGGNHEPIADFIIECK